MPSLPEIEKELNRVLRVKPKDGELEQLYLSRIVTTSQTIPEETWYKLSAAAQRWCNAAAKAFEAKENISGFPPRGKSK